MAQQVVAAPLAEGTAYKTCKLTLVNSGRSDSVIKIRPSEHVSEKIFLDNTRGVERWQAIERLMQGYAKRGTMVSKPVEYHQFPDLKTVVITEDDIPTVDLEGMVFAAPLTEERAGDVPAPLPQGVAALEGRVGGLEKTLGTMSELLTRLVLLQTPATPVAPQATAVGTPQYPTGEEFPVTLPAEESLVCCGKTFKNKVGLIGHKRFKHT